MFDTWPALGDNRPGFSILGVLRFGEIFKCGANPVDLVWKPSKIDASFRAIRSCSGTQWRFTPRLWTTASELPACNLDLRARRALLRLYTVRFTMPSTRSNPSLRPT